MANRFKIIRGNKKNNDNEIITCNGLGLTRKQERDILSKSKYRVGQPMFVAQDDGTILEHGEIEDTFYDKQDDGSFTYVYNMHMEDDMGESFINGVFEAAMNEQGFYSRDEYINKFQKEPVYVPLPDEYFDEGEQTDTLG